VRQRVSTFSRFVQALNITNAALEAHQDSLLFKPMLVACRLMLGDENLGVAIFQHDPDDPHDFFTIRMQDGTFVLVDRGDTEIGIDWLVSEDYLQDVASHPARYIENPELLDFDWLKKRAGMVV
jgi:hypothetical protein